MKTCKDFNIRLCSYCIHNNPKYYKYCFIITMKEEIENKSKEQVREIILAYFSQPLGMYSFDWFQVVLKEYFPDHNKMLDNLLLLK